MTHFLQSFWKSLYNHRYQAAFSAVLAAFVYWVTGANPLLVGLVVGVSVSIFAPLFAGMHFSILKPFRARMASTSGPSWGVKLNDVQVGSISDAEYAAIQYKSLTSPHVFLQQGLNLLRVVFKLTDLFYVGAPIVLFWGVIALIVFSPGTLMHAFSTLQRTTPVDLQHAVLHGLFFLALFTVGAAAILSSLGVSRFGYINCFDAYVSQAIRQHCGCAAEGRLVVISNDHGAYRVHFFDRQPGSSV